MVPAVISWQRNSEVSDRNSRQSQLTDFARHAREKEKTNPTQNTKYHGTN